HPRFARVPERAPYNYALRFTLYASPLDAAAQRPAPRLMNENLPPLLTMRGISKAYPGVVALDNVDFEVRAGEVHALVGENGAGKSTLMKILAGAESRDAGEILLNGRPVAIDSPQKAMDLGINIIYQEFNLVPHLSAGENIFLGREPAARLPGFIDFRR